jgi:hypothetical protein
VQTAQQPNAQAQARRQSVPGIGKIVRGVLLSESRISPASHGARLLCPTAAGAHAPRSQRESGLAPPGPRSARRTSRGPVRKRRAYAFATTRRVKPISPAESKNMARARPGPA